MDAASDACAQRLVELRQCAQIRGCGFVSDCHAFVQDVNEACPAIEDATVFLRASPVGACLAVQRTNDAMASQCAGFSSVPLRCYAYRHRNCPEMLDYFGCYEDWLDAIDCPHGPWDVPGFDCSLGRCVGPLAGGGSSGASGATVSENCDELCTIARACEPAAVPQTCAAQCASLFEDATGDCQGRLDDLRFCAQVQQCSWRPQCEAFTGDLDEACPRNVPGPGHTIFGTRGDEQACYALQDAHDAIAAQCGALEPFDFNCPAWATGGCADSLACVGDWLSAIECDAQPPDGPAHCVSAGCPPPGTGFPDVCTDPPFEGGCCDEELAVYGCINEGWRVQLECFEGTWYDYSEWNCWECDDDGYAQRCEE